MPTESSIQPANFQDLVERFRLTRYKDESQRCGGCLLDLTTTDLSIVHSVMQLTGGADRVWTLVECDGHEYIAHGHHFVNRVGYLISEVALVADMACDIHYTSDVAFDEKLEQVKIPLADIQQSGIAQISGVATQMIERINNYLQQVAQESVAQIWPDDLMGELVESIEPLAQSGDTSAQAALAILESDDD